MTVKMKKRIRLLVKVAFAAILALSFLLPFYLVALNSIKTMGEVTQNPFSLPQEIHWENYISSWKALNMGKAFINTAIVAICSTLLITILSAMVAYWTVRHPTRFSRLFEMFLLGSILIPFPTIMLPIVKTLSAVRLSGTLIGGIICYTGMGIAFSYFIMRGAVLSIPKELEEAAIMDGSSVYYAFFRIIFPLMTPTAISVFILEIFWIWNDYNIALVVLNNDVTKTIQLSINGLFSQYISRWDIALPALVIGILPIFIVNILLQKKILAGMTAGAIKG